MGRFHVGDIVYPHYAPAKVGKVVAVQDNGVIPAAVIAERREQSREHAEALGIKVLAMSNIAPAADVPRPDTLTVKRPNGTTYEVGELGVASFAALVDDHQRKAAKHAATLAACLEIQP